MKAKLCAKDQFLMYLYCLEMLRNTMISCLFDASKSSVSIYLNTWTNLLDFSCASIFIWPKKSIILNNVSNFQNYISFHQIHYGLYQNIFAKSPHHCPPKVAFAQVISTLSNLKVCLEQLHLEQKVFNSQKQQPGRFL